MSTENQISKEELYKIALETRNFEISMFWQRSNYFLALNTVVAVGFFSGSVKDHQFQAVSLSVFGIIVSLLWFLVNLGGKFWQSRWEHRLRLVEQGVSPEIEFFSADWKTIRKDVEASLNFARHSRIPRFFDRLVLTKPSVSLMMILLSLVFVLLWLVLLGITLLT